MRKRGIFVIGLFVVIFMIGICSSASDYCATAEVSDISPSSIEIGEEFTVGVQIESCGNKAPEFVTFELVNPPVDLEIKESLKINISNLYYGNSERILVYHMKTLSDAIPGEYIIKTKLTYGTSDYSRIENGEIKITIRGDEAKLSIASAKTDPVIPRVGDTVELTLRIENFGNGNANSIKVSVEHLFKGTKEAFIGTLENDEDGPAVFTFVVNKAGEFEFPVNINYEDDFGKQQVSFGLRLIVLRKSVNWILIFFLIVIIGAAIWGFFNYKKLKRSKNKIIHQLLNEKEKEEFSEELVKSKKKKSGKDDVK